MEAVDEINSSERLVRSTFAPEHFDGTDFANTAISLEDLDHKGVSVDREHLTSWDSVNQRHDAQIQRAPEKRVEAVYSVLIVGAIGEIRCDDDLGAFCVQTAPINGNDGHALILSAHKRGKGALRGLRLKLLELMKEGLVCGESLNFKA